MIWLTSICLKVVSTIEIDYLNYCLLHNISYYFKFIDRYLMQWQLQHWFLLTLTFFCYLLVKQNDTAQLGIRANSYNSGYLVHCCWIIVSVHEVQYQFLYFNHVEHYFVHCRMGRDLTLYHWLKLCKRFIDFVRLHWKQSFIVACYMHWSDLYV